MRDVSRVSNGREAGFVAALLEAAQESAAGEEGACRESLLVGGIARRLGVCSEVMSGLLRGVEALAAYGLSDLDGSTDVLEEEDRALEASRRAMLPVLQARLQARIDAVDMEEAGQAICPKLFSARIH